MIIKLTKLRIIIAAVFICMVVISITFYAFSKRNVKQTITMPDGAPLLIIDAGHGGFDSGAVAADDTFEKDLNLAVALKLSEQAKALGYNTIMIRDSDDAVAPNDEEEVSKLTDMRTRLKIMGEYENSIFVSIHMNEFSSGAPNGAQVFYAPNEFAKESAELAEFIQKSIATDLQHNNKRTIKKGTKDAYLLYYAKSCAVIVECGFLSNAEDLKNLKNDEYQSKLAFSILKGILDYYRQ